jgi:hypothetical protein
MSTCDRGREAEQEGEEYEGRRQGGRGHMACLVRHTREDREVIDIIIDRFARQRQVHAWMLFLCGFVNVHVVVPYNRGSSI